MPRIAERSACFSCFGSFARGLGVVTPVLLTGKLKLGEANEVE